MHILHNFVDFLKMTPQEFFGCLVNGLTDEYEKAIKWYLMHEVPQIGSACISSNKDDLTRDKEHGADYTCLDIAPPTGNGDGEDKKGKDRLRRKFWRVP